MTSICLLRKWAALIAAALLIPMLGFTGCNSKPKLPVGTWAHDTVIDHKTVTLTKEHVLIIELYLKPTGARVVNRFKVTSWYRSDAGLVMYTENGLQFFYDRANDIISDGAAYNRVD